MNQQHKEAQRYCTRWMTQEAKSTQRIARPECASLARAFAIRGGLSRIAVTATLFLGITAPAHAEEAMAEDDQQRDSIVVTGARETVSSGATGLPLDIVDTPQSVTLVEREILDEFAFDEINDVLAIVPGINVEQVETDRTYYNARGFDITWLMEDGLAIPNVYGPTSGSLDTVFYDRIEVVRGANALLSGIGNPAGTINFIRRRPTGMTGGSASLSYGSWDTVRGEADIDLALSEDGSWGLRVTGAAQTGDSYLRDYQVDRFAGQAILSGTLTQGLTATLGFSRQENNAEGVLWGALPMLYTDGTPTDFPVETSTTQDWTFWDTTNQRAFGELALDLGENWQVRTVLTRQDIESDSELFYVYGTPDPDTGLGLFGYPGAYEYDAGGWVSDTELTGKYGLFGRQHDLTLGVQYSDSTFTYHGYPVPGTDPAWGALPALPDWTGEETARPAYGERTDQADFDYRIARIYGATRLELTDRLHLIGGANIIDVEAEGISYGVDFGRDEDALSPFVGVTYDVASNVNLYASYSDIFLPQHELGEDLSPLGAAKGQSYELGIKGQTADGMLFGSVALFRAEQSNLAESLGFDPGSGMTLYTGVDVTSQGIEAEIGGRITPTLMLQGGVTHLSLEDENDDPTRTYVPRTTADLALRWQALEALSLGAVLNWQDDIYLDSAAGRISQCSFATLQLQAGYQINDRLELQLNVANVTDEKYLASLYWEQAYYAAPRNFTATIRGRF